MGGVVRRRGWVVMGAGRRPGAPHTPKTLEDLVQPLTTLLARLEVLQAQVRSGELDDLTRQLVAVRTSAECLAARTDELRTPRRPRCGDVDGDLLSNC